MYPVPNFRSVIETWEMLRANPVLLFGFLLYTEQHETVYKYVRERRGLLALDKMLSESYHWKCGVFVLEPATNTWRLWAVQQKHPWCRIYCQPETCDIHSSRINQFDSGDSEWDAVMANIDNVAVIAGAAGRMWLQDYFEPPF